jgi:hypothetical protein
VGLNSLKSLNLTNVYPNNKKNKNIASFQSLPGPRTLYSVFAQNVSVSAENVSFFAENVSIFAEKVFVFAMGRGATRGY